MAEMDAERVIAELQEYHDREWTDERTYPATRETRKRVTGNALELLKEHEAKLLTFDEVKKHYSIPNELHGDIKKTIDYANDIVPLYMECTYEDEWVVHWRDYHNISMHLDSWEKDYGKTWRCWTAKPTDEQRSAIKWN